MRIRHEGCSIVGRRDNNEDALLALSELGFYAIADGMGGYEGGEVASKLALASLQAYFELLGPDGLAPDEDPEGRLAKEKLGLAIRIAHREVVRRATGRLRRMGTTLACLATRGERAVIAHVGDSRVYRLRDGELQALTRDHSLLAEMEASGAVGAHGIDDFALRNIITQAVGQRAVVHPDLRVEPVLAGDRFLLCSDGLTDVLSSGEIAWGLSRTRDVAQALCESAYEAGSMDNITALVVTAS